MRDDDSADAEEDNDVKTMIKNLHHDYNSFKVWRDEHITAGRLQQREGRYDAHCRGENATYPNSKWVSRLDVVQSVGGRLLDLQPVPHTRT